MIEPTAPSAPPRALKPQPLEAVPAYRPAPRVRPEVAWSLARLALDCGMLLAAVLASSLATARDSTRIIEAVDALYKDLRGRIGESLRSIRAIVIRSPRPRRFPTEALSGNWAIRR